MLNGVKQAAADAARTAALLSVGLLILLIGLGFLTLAAWIYLSITYDALTASLIIGCCYAGVGLIFIAVALMSNGSSRRHAVRQQQRVQAAASSVPPKSPPLVQAFLYGMQAGLNAGARRD
ncbi:DUF1705 domain-containing protein [Sulfitobacter sp. BDSS02]|nr:DUF1705 domain-containing protein [Sulfitobacter sp. BDSS02]MBR9847855.1 DUF1705 domain-containing protein [Paracoccaceae bacterium]